MSWIWRVGDANADGSGSHALLIADLRARGPVEKGVAFLAALFTVTVTVNAAVGAAQHLAVAGGAANAGEVSRRGDQRRRTLADVVEDGE